MAISIHFPTIGFKVSKDCNDFDAIVDEVESLNAKRSALDPLKDYAKRNAITAKKIAKVQSSARLYFDAGSDTDSKQREFSEWMEDNGVNFDTFKMQFFDLYVIRTKKKKDKDMDEFGGSCIIDTVIDTDPEEIAAEEDFDY